MSLSPQPQPRTTSTAAPWTGSRVLVARPGPLAMLGAAVSTFSGLKALVSALLAASLGGALTELLTGAALLGAAFLLLGRSWARVNTVTWELEIHRQRPFQTVRILHAFPFDEVDCFDVVQRPDSDGDSMWTVVVRLRSGTEEQVVGYLSNGKDRAFTFFAERGNALLAQYRHKATGPG